MHAKDTLSADFPAYSLVRKYVPQYSQYEGADVVLRDGDSVGVLSATRHGEQFIKQFTAGSVASYAIRNDECPIEAVQNAKARGHKLYWLNEDAVCISAHEQTKREIKEIRVGDVALFEGKRFKIAAVRGRIELELVA